MRDVRIAAAQFEHRNGDKAYNLRQIDRLAGNAAADGAEVISFHECSITAYTFLQSLARADMVEMAEPVPGGASVDRLVKIAAKHRIAILAGLLEIDGDRLYNTYVCVNEDGLVAKHRKLHPFISPHLSPGDAFTVFDLAGAKCGILICYDNNLPENVRATTLLGAEIIFMPHVTGCSQTAMPGSGRVDPDLWYDRERDPIPLRMEFEGPKYRGWLMRWLPARALENGIYCIFTNPIGIDDDQVRGGRSMIVDPFGQILSECTWLGDGYAFGICTAEKIEVSGGQRYLKARRPELYGPLVAPNRAPSVTRPGWELKPPPDA